MKHGLLAHPGGRWDGFQPTAYSLDLQKVASLPLVRVDGGVREPTTIFDVLQHMKGRKIESVESAVWTDIKVEGQIVKLEGTHFNQQLLHVLLHFQNEGIDGVNRTKWFYFGDDWNLRDIQMSYSFFVVSGDKIVREHVRFSDWPESGFDPEVFEAEDPDLWNWRHDSDWAEADVRYWYRRFYTETRTGQLMVLRDDKPKLHYFEEEQGKRSVLLSRIYILLWFVLVLLLIITIAIRR